MYNARRRKISIRHRDFSIEEKNSQMKKINRRIDIKMPTGIFQHGNRYLKKSLGLIHELKNLQI